MSEHFNYSQSSYQSLEREEPNQNFFERILRRKPKRNVMPDNQEIIFEKIDDEIVMNDTAKEFYEKNAFRSQKYNAVTFLPKVIWDVFSEFYNFYLLVISILFVLPWFITDWSWVNWIPITLFTAGSIGKEGYADNERKKKDEQINNKKYTRLIKGKEERILSKNIVPGDLIKINAGQIVPADIILLNSSKENEGCLFVKTDQLDGESDWKLRHGIDSFRKYSHEEISKITGYRFKVIPPDKNLHEAGASFELDNQTQSLDITNMILANSEIATGCALGFVIYTGKYTKNNLNSSKLITKKSQIDSEANLYTLSGFILQLIISVIFGLVKNVNENTLIVIIQNLLYLSYVVPQSLRVNLDFSKMYYRFMIKRDKELKGITIRNMEAMEEIGRISFVVADKTGTLTRNEMRFKKCKIKGETFDSEKISSLLNNENSLPQLENLKMFLTAVVLCHNVTPSEKGDEEQFKGASTDEIELVSFAKSVGFKLLSKKMNQIEVEILKEKRTYRVVREIPFSHQKKRMGILLIDEDRVEEPKGLFITKGADEVIAPMAKDKNVFAQICEEARDLASDGLRTIVYASKELNSHEVDNFQTEYKELTVRETRQMLLKNILESNLNYLGTSAVEDLLCDSVKKTYESLKLGGIKVWVLTGDRRETAVCVAKAMGMITLKSKVIVLKNSNVKKISWQSNYTERDVGNTIKNYFKEKTKSVLSLGSDEKKNCVFVVESNALKICLNHSEKEFFKFTNLFDSVIVCRGTPKQKELVTKGLQKYFKQRVAAIGDGGNDVGMITVANVGIGIEGKEGKKASMAADLVVKGFSSLPKIFFWHGRNSNSGSSNLLKLIFWRGIKVGAIQAAHSVAHKFNPLLFFNYMFMLFFNIVYTSVPLLSIIIDRDINEENSMLFPEFYKEQNNNRNLVLSIFWILFWGSYEGVVIYTIPFFFFKEKMSSKAMSVVLSSLVASEIFEVAMMIKTWKLKIFFGLFLSFSIFVLTTFAVPDLFDKDYVRNYEYYLIYVGLSLVASVPPFLIKNLIQSNKCKSDRTKISSDKD